MLAAVVAGWADQGTAPAAQGRDSAWAAEELGEAEPEAVAVVRLAASACGARVPREAAELPGAAVEQAAGQAVEEGPEPARERGAERKWPHLENG